MTRRSLLADDRRSACEHCTAVVPNRERVGGLCYFCRQRHERVQAARVTFQADCTAAGDVTPAELAERFGISHCNAWRRLKTAVELGQAKQVGRGKYRPLGADPAATLRLIGRPTYSRVSDVR